MLLTDMLRNFSEDNLPTGVGQVRSISEKEKLNICNYHPPAEEIENLKKSLIETAVEKDYIYDTENHYENDYDYDNYIFSTKRKRRFSGSNEDVIKIPEGPYLENPWKTDVLDENEKFLCRGIVVSSTVVIDRVRNSDLLYIKFIIYLFFKKYKLEPLIQRARLVVSTPRLNS